MIQLATPDPVLQFKVLKAVLQLLATEFQEDAVPAVLGTKRDRIIHQMTGCLDPYKELKMKSNEIALKLVQRLETKITGEKDPYQRFRLAVLLAIVGNILEFDILEHSIDLNDPQLLEDLITKAEQDLAVDYIPEIYEKVRETKQVLYLTDNAGEIIFDRFLIVELLNLGVHVTVAVKENPVLNDATLEDAAVAGLVELSHKNPRLEIITTGSDHVGLIVEEISDTFRPYFENAELIIAKGMGYYETLDRLFQKPRVFLFRTKCSSVAEEIGIQIDQNVAILREKYVPLKNFL